MKWPPTLDGTARRWLVAGFTVCLVLALRSLPLWPDISGRAFDLLSTIGQPVPPEPGVVIIAIDEPSFDAIGKPWPWPRDLHAQLVGALRAEGANAVTFDIVFAEPSNPDADAALAAALDDRTVLAATEVLIETSQAASLVRTDPLSELLGNGARAGLIAVSLDSDGVVRRIASHADSLPRQMLAASGKTLKEDTSAPKLIQYFGPPGSYPRVSYYQALQPKTFLPPNYFKGRDVIVGQTDASAGVDAFETPYTIRTGELTSGVEIQATVADNLLHGLAIAPTPQSVAILLLLLGAAVGYVASAAGAPLVKIVYGASAILAVVILSWLGLYFGRSWVSPGEPILGVAMMVFVLATYDYEIERRQRREIQGAFCQYVSPAIVERLIQNPSLLKLGGERKVLTILFADLRGFTALSEAMKDDPEGLTHIVNDVFTRLSDIVIAHGGTIDKYIGDCIMAFWNAPLDDSNHAVNAVAAGVAMVESLPAINASVLRWFEEGETAKREIRLGVGINTGECIVGNMGSTRRFAYTVLGDAVNLAARIEELTKDYNVPLLMGEQTAALLCDGLHPVKVDDAPIRGRMEGLPIFTLRSSNLHTG